MKNKNTIIYWVSTGLFSALMLMSGTVYFLQNPMVVEAYSALGYPVYLIYPVAIAKLTGVAAILSRKSLFLKDLAYAGFFYLSLLAIGAHVSVGDGQFMAAAVSLVLVSTSYCYQRKVFKK